LPERSTRYQKKRNIQSDQIKNKIVSQATPKPQPKRPSPRSQPRQEVTQPQPEQQQPRQEQVIVDGTEPTVTTTDILGREVQQDTLGVEEESDKYKEGPGGFVEGLFTPTQQITQMGKDVIEGVPAEQQVMRPSMIDLAVQPVIGTLAAAKQLGYTERDWYSPIGWFDNKALPGFLQRNPDEQRDFFTGMSDNFGIIGDTVTNERWLQDVNQGVDFEGDGKIDMVGYDQTLNVWNPDSEIRKYPGYYIGSAIGEVPYFLSPAIALKGPVQTAKILASATRIAGKATLSVDNIRITGKLANVGKGLQQTLQNEKKLIGTDKTVNTKVPKEGLEILEKNIDNKIKLKERLSIEYSKRGLNDNKIAKSANDLEDEIMVLRKEKQELRSNYNTALDRFNTARSEYKAGKAKIEDVNYARDRYITVVQRDVEDKVHVAYMSKNDEIIKTYDQRADLHKATTRNKIMDLKREIEKGNMTEKQVKRTNSKIDKLQRSLDNDMPRSDRVALTIEKAPEDVVSYIKKILPKHRWSSLGREVTIADDAPPGSQVGLESKKVKFEDQIKRYDGNAVLAGIMYSMRKSNEGLGFAFHKTEKSLSEANQFGLRERVLVVPGDRASGSGQWVAYRGKVDETQMSVLKEKWESLQQSSRNITDVRKGFSSETKTASGADIKRAEGRFKIAREQYQEELDQFQLIEDFNPRQLVRDDGTMVPVSDIEGFTVATRIPDTQFEKLGKVEGIMTYTGQIGTNINVIAQKTNVRTIKSLLGDEATDLAKDDWLYKGYVTADSPSLRGGGDRKASGNAYVQIPADMRRDDFISIQRRLGLDSPRDIVTGVKKEKVTQEYTYKGKPRYRKVKKETDIIGTDILEGDPLYPYIKLDNVKRSRIVDPDDTLIGPTKNQDLEKIYKMTGKSYEVRVSDDPNSPRLDVGDVVEHREVLEVRKTPESVEYDISQLRGKQDTLRYEIKELETEVEMLTKNTEKIDIRKNYFLSKGTIAQREKGSEVASMGKEYAKDKKKRLEELKNEIKALKGKLSGDDLEVLRQRAAELDGELTSMEYGVTEIDKVKLGTKRQDTDWNRASQYGEVSDDVHSEYIKLALQREDAINTHKLITEGRYTKTPKKMNRLDLDILELEDTLNVLKKKHIPDSTKFDATGKLIEATEQTLAIKRASHASLTMKEELSIENITPKVAMTVEEAEKYNVSGTRTQVEDIVAKLQAEKIGIQKEKTRLNKKAWFGIQNADKSKKYPYADLDLKNAGEMTKYLIMRDRDKKKYDKTPKSRSEDSNKKMLYTELATKEAELAFKQSELKSTYGSIARKGNELERVEKAYEFFGESGITGGVSRPRGQFIYWTGKTLKNEGVTSPDAQLVYFEGGGKRFEIVTMVKKSKENEYDNLLKLRDEAIKLENETGLTGQRTRAQRNLDKFRNDESNYELTAVDYDVKIQEGRIDRITNTELNSIFKTKTANQALEKLMSIQSSLARKKSSEVTGVVKKKVLGIAIPILRKTEGVIEDPISVVKSLTGGRVKPVYRTGIDYAEDAKVTDNRIISGDWKYRKLSAVLQTTDKTPLLTGDIPAYTDILQVYKIELPRKPSEEWRGTDSLERLVETRDVEIYAPIRERTAKFGNTPMANWAIIESGAKRTGLDMKLRQNLVKQYYINIKKADSKTATRKAIEISKKKVDKKTNYEYDSKEFKNIVNAVMTPDTFRRPNTVERITAKRLQRAVKQEGTDKKTRGRLWYTQITPGAKGGFIDINEMERATGVGIKTIKGGLRDRTLSYVADVFKLKQRIGAGNQKEQIIKKMLLEKARDDNRFHKFTRKNRKILDSGTRIESADELAISRLDAAMPDSIPLVTDDDFLRAQRVQQGMETFGVTKLKKRGTKEGEIDRKDTGMPGKETDRWETEFEEPEIIPTVRETSPVIRESERDMILRIQAQIEVEEGITFKKLLPSDVRVRYAEMEKELGKKIEKASPDEDLTEIKAERSELVSVLKSDEKVKLDIKERYFEKVTQPRPDARRTYGVTGATYGTLGAQVLPMAFAEEQQVPQEVQRVNLAPPNFEISTDLQQTTAQAPITTQTTKISTEQARVLTQTPGLRLDLTPKTIQSSVIRPALTTGAGLTTVPSLMLGSAQAQMIRYTTVGSMQVPPTQRQLLEPPRPPMMAPPTQRIVPPMAPFLPPWLEGGYPDSDKDRNRKKKKKKQFWMIPENWYEPGYWQKKKDPFTGKWDYTGSGYGTFKGKEPKRLKNTWDMK